AVFVAARRYSPPRTEPDSGPSLTLIGPGHWPRDLQVVFKNEDIVPERQSGDRGLVVRAERLALLELLREPPWPTYRIEGEVRHDNADGTVGLYFARKVYAGAGGPEHWFCRFGFCDRAGGLADVRVCRAGAGFAWSAVCPPLAVVPPLGGRYRKLRVTVTPQ